MRAFISINLSPETLQQFADIQEKISSTLDKREASSMRWESIDKLHITMLFLGEVSPPELKEVKKSLSHINPGIGKIDFTSRSIGAFPNLRSPRVLFANLKENGQLLTLAGEIHNEMKKLGYTSDKNFHPHITLGRIKRDRKVNLTKLSSINFDINFSASSFHLMESKLLPTGSKYSIIEKYSL